MHQTQSVVLRHTKDALGSRYLQATLRGNGNVVIEGQDLGKGVEDVFGEGLTEYEFAMTIQAADIPGLLKALEAQGDVLSALQHQFKSHTSTEPGTFLNTHNVPYEFWSRLGD